MATVLSLCQDASAEAHLIRVSAVVGVTTEATGLLLNRALMKTARELQDYNWQRLHREKTFTTVAAETQTDTPIPIDFLRFIPDTLYNRTSRQRVYGPLSEDEWQAMQATAATWSYDSFRIRNAAWLMAPVPTAGHTIAYEYITKYVGTDTTEATPRTTFTVDTDLTYFDDELMILGIAKNVLDITGADYAEKSREFQLRLASLLKQDGGSRVITVGSGGGQSRVPVAPRVPDLLVFT